MLHAKTIFKYFSFQRLVAHRFYEYESIFKSGFHFLGTSCHHKTRQPIAATRFLHD